jgi:hypothetical protein
MTEVLTKKLNFQGIKHENWSRKVKTTDMARRIVFTKITAFWNITPCSLAEVDRRFRGAHYLRHERDE